MYTYICIYIYLGSLLDRLDEGGGGAAGDGQQDGEEERGTAEGVTAGQRDEHGGGDRRAARGEAARKRAGAEGEGRREDKNEIEDENEMWYLAQHLVFDQVAVCSRVMHRVTVWCVVLQCVAECGIQRNTLCLTTLRCAAVFCRVVLCGAVCCSVVLCVAVC